MGFQSVQSTYVPVLAVPMWGMSTQAIADASLVLGLTNRASVKTLSQDFTMNAPTGSGLYMYFAYPVDMGLAQFLDVDSQFVGGWDGANDDPYNVYGPVILNVTTPSGEVVPFYVFRTDYSDLGNVRWVSSLAA